MMSIFGLVSLANAAAAAAAAATAAAAARYWASPCHCTASLSGEQRRQAQLLSGCSYISAKLAVSRYQPN